MKKKNIYRDRLARQSPMVSNHHPLVYKTDLCPLGHSHSTLQSMQSLSDQVTADRADSKLPLLVIASLGSHLCGQTDDILSLVNLCKDESLWLHVEGYNLASLCLLEQVPDDAAQVGFF